MRPSPGSAPTYRYVGATAKSRDGWDSLGDLGYFDEDGFLYLNDRRVDMFTVGGRNVYPAEIESALSAHPNVLSCLVVGVPDDDLGQVPHAIVQADGLDEAAVIAFLSDRIAGYKVPRTVEFSDTPLRDDAGKARRSAVRDEVIARRARARSLTALSSGGTRTSPNFERRGSSTSLPAPQRDSARRLDQRVADRRDREAEHHRQHQHDRHVPVERELTDDREHHRQRREVPDEQARRTIGPASPSSVLPNSRCGVSGRSSTSGAISAPATTAPIAVFTMNWLTVPGVSPPGPPAAMPPPGTPATAMAAMSTRRRASRCGHPIGRHRQLGEQHARREPGEEGWRPVQRIDAEGHVEGDRAPSRSWRPPPRR